MEKLAIHATTRKVLGKKVKTLRNTDITPIHVFGRGIESLALQAETPAMEKLLKQAGSTHLIALAVDKHKEPHNVMISNVQRNSISGRLIHVDFHEIQMGELITVSIPLRFVGDSPAAKSKSVSLLRNTSSIRVQCLPANIPLNIPVDITHLADVGDSVFVKELKIPKDVTVLEEPEELVIRVYRPRVEVEVVEAAPAAEAVAAEGAEAVAAEGAEGAAPEGAAAPAATTEKKGGKEKASAPEPKKKAAAPEPKK